MEELSKEQQIIEAQKIKKNYPGRIPIILYKDVNCRNLPELDKNKFLAAREITVGEFVWQIRQRLPIDSSEAMFIIVNNTIPANTETLESVYDRLLGGKGFLIMIYSKENFFG